MKALLKTTGGVILANIPDINLPIEKDKVVLKVKMVGLCRTDLLVASDVIKTSKDNLILGHEFSAQVVYDPSDQLKEGQWVGFNPLINNKFMGLDFDGALCEYVVVDRNYIIPSNIKDPRLIAYLEPIAASMAVLKALPTANKSSYKIGVVGLNRIATLTTQVLRSDNYIVDELNEHENFNENHYDYVIETVFEENVFKKIIYSLKEGGTLIVKSRKKVPVNIIASDLVAKEITLKAVNYYDFNLAMSWLEENYLLVTPLLGSVFHINDWKKAFEVAESGEQLKTFISL